MRVLFTKDVCERTFCLPVENCEKGFVLTSGCCPVCQAILTEDQTCWTMAVTFDGTPTGRCEEGLSCKQGICTRDEKQDHNSCEERRELRLQLKKENLIAEEAWVPTCDARGGYEAKQCKSNNLLSPDDREEEAATFRLDGRPPDTLRLPGQLRGAAVRGRTLLLRRPDDRQAYGTPGAHPTDLSTAVL
ncbi:uncharacterized protein ISCGN_004515 [Ixodes scapularis]